MSDEMVEKARAYYPKWEGAFYNESNQNLNEAFEFAADFARSAVRDALAEMDKFTTHGYDCSMHHAWNPANKHCDCGLSALRKKFEVDDGI